MKKYLAYTRVSTVKQGTKGVSLQEQKSAIENHALRHGLAISDWYEETVTAAKTGRAVFSTIMKKLSKGEADGLIIHKIDRSARNLKDWALLGELIDKGIDVQIAAENYDLSSRGGRLSADIQAVVAADYIRNLREEAYKGMRGRLKQGLYPFKAPVGYIDNGQGKVKTLDPTKAALVKQVFELYASGRYSIRMLAETMHLKGLYSHRGGKLGKNGISKILCNPFYYGLILVKTTGETYKGIHEPLISKSLFKKVQDIRSGKYRVKVINHNYQYKRVFKCADCGYSLIGERQKGNIYYRCHTKDCETKTIREDELSKQIDEVIKNICVTRDLIKGLKIELEKQKELSEKEQEKILNTYTLKLSQAKKRVSRLMDLFIDEKIADEVFKEKQNILEQEIDSLEERVSDIGNHIGQIMRSVEKFLELVESLILGYKKIPQQFRGELLKSITSNPTVSARSVDIPINMPWLLFANTSSGSFSGGKRDKTRTYNQDLYKTLIDELKENFRNNPLDIIDIDLAIKSTKSTKSFKELGHPNF